MNTHIFISHAGKPLVVFGERFNICGLLLTLSLRSSIGAAL